MCEYLSFCSEWKEGDGVQVYASRNLRGHSETTQLWNLSPDARRWSWENDGENNLVLAHGQAITPDTERERIEILRQWPNRAELTTHLFGRLIANDKLDLGGGLSLDGCTGLTQLPDGLSVGGYLSLYGCTGLTTLPDGLSVGGDLSLSGCTGLTTLPDGLSVGGYLSLSGCTGLNAAQEAALRKMAKR